VLRPNRRIAGVRMKRQMFNSCIAFSLMLAAPAIAMDVENQACTDTTLLAQIPKHELPSQQQGLPPNAERGPKVITNPNPTQTDTVGATEVKDANPATKEGVRESNAWKLITPPGKGKRPSVRTVEGRKTMAIAFGGGGARGAAHIGVLRVLEQEKIPIDYIVGNSMGAVIGGAYAAGVPLEKIKMAGMTGEMRKAYLPGLVSRILLMPFSQLSNKLNIEKKYAGLWTGKKFERCLDKLLPKDVPPIECLKIPFSAVATNLLDGNAYRLSEGKLSRAIRASSTISPLLKPVKIGDNLYVDGGIRANLPASAAKDTGADVVIAVLVDEPIRELPDSTFFKYKAVAGRLADIILAVTDEHQLQFADVIINPDVSGIPVLSKKPEDAARAIRAGEEAARKALPAIRKKMGLSEKPQVAKEAPPLQREDDNSRKRPASTESAM